MPALVKGGVIYMRSFKNFLALFFVVAAALAANVTAQGPASDTRSIEQRIYKRLLNVNNYGVFDFITFQYEDGTVILNGKVSSFGTKDEAVSDIKGIAGVEKVINNIEQLPASPWDDEIRRQAMFRFQQRGPSQYFSERRPQVHVIVENGRVTLEGYVSGKGHSDLIYMLVNGIPGVFSVQNNLIVGRDELR
jgi:hyperosmotically inducible protein